MVACILLAGCFSQPQREESSHIVTDDLGRTVKLPGSIDRVITLAPNLTELVFAAGSGDKLVGVTSADNFPPAVDSLPRFSALPLNFEAIASLNPDLILATDHVNSIQDAETFEAIGLPVYFLSFNSLEGLLRSLRKVGELLHTTDVAQHVADSLQAEIEALRHITQAVETPPLTLFLIGDDTMYSFGDESYVHDLIELAGGQSATRDFGASAPVLSEEYVLTKKPAVVIGAFGESYDTSRLLELHPTWDIVPAVQNSRLYSMNPDLILRPGPRLIEGTWYMARLLHPELF